MARRRGQGRTVGQIEWQPDRDAAVTHATNLIRDVAEVSVSESAGFVLAHERRNVPVRTGRTRDGLTIEETGQGGLFEAEVAERDPLRQHVAFFLNEGTSRMPATHFADDAVTAERRRMTRRVSKRVKGRLGGDK